MFCDANQGHRPFFARFAFSAHTKKRDRDNMQRDSQQCRRQADEQLVTRLRPCHWQTSREVRRSAVGWLYVQLRRAGEIAAASLAHGCSFDRRIGPLRAFKVARKYESTCAAAAQRIIDHIHFVCISAVSASPRDSSSFLFDLTCPPRRRENLLMPFAYTLLQHRAQFLFPTPLHRC
jgi:hypothetical protein